MEYFFFSPLTLNAVISYLLEVKKCPKIVLLSGMTPRSSLLVDLSSIQGVFPSNTAGTLREGSIQVLPAHYTPEKKDKDCYYAKNVTEGVVKNQP